LKECPWAFDLSGAGLSPSGVFGFFFPGGPVPRLPEVDLFSASSFYFFNFPYGAEPPGSGHMGVTCALAIFFPI